MAGAASFGIAAVSIVRRPLRRGVTAIRRIGFDLQFALQPHKPGFEFLQPAILVQQRSIQAVDVVLQMSQHGFYAFKSVIR